MKLEEKIFELISSEISIAGYKLDSVSYVNEDGANFLRIVIDSVNGINVEDCVTVCNLINPILDEEDPIEESYILDVCSKESGR